jgi:hypothetical protein
MEALLWIVGVVILVYLVVSFLTYTNISSLENTHLNSYELPIPQKTAEWAQANEFEYVGSYRTRLGSTQTDIWTWQRSDRPTFFCRYLVKAKDITKVSHDLVTEFADDIGLTTGDTKDGNFLPRPPGSYSHNFPGTSLDEQWYKHIESENYLMDHGKVQLKAEDVEFEQSITKGIKQHVNYIKTLPLWPLRGPYWYFIRRYVWHNKSIEEQHRKGMIKLPNELTEQEKEFIKSLKTDGQQENDFSQSV